MLERNSTGLSLPQPRPRPRPHLPPAPSSPNLPPSSPNLPPSSTSFPPSSSPSSISIPPSTALPLSSTSMETVPGPAAIAKEPMASPSCNDYGGRPTCSVLHKLDQVGRIVPVSRGTFEHSLLMNKLLSSTLSAADLCFRPNFSACETDCYRICNSDAKLHAYQAKKLEAERMRGTANEVDGWHGTSAEALEAIVLYGFALPPVPASSREFGAGVYLAHHQRADISISYAKADPENDNMKYILLCQAILGSPEVIQHGSQQIVPSDLKYDSGLDHWENPTQYIIWSPTIFAQILPRYVIALPEDCLMHRPPPLEEQNISGQVPLEQENERRGPWSGTHPAVREQTTQTELLQ